MGQQQRIRSPPTALPLPVTAAAAICLLATGCSAVGAADHDSAPLPRWPDTSVGVHEFLTMDIAYKGKTADIKAAASRFDFVWGTSLGQSWRNVSTTMVTSLYTPYAGDSNITWWQLNHPEWLLYKCDRTTPAYWNGIKADVPLDMSSEDAVRFKFNRIGGRNISAAAYTAIAADMFYLENTAGACGVWRAPPPLPSSARHRAPAGEEGPTAAAPAAPAAAPAPPPEWVQLFSGGYGDPKWCGEKTPFTKPFIRTFNLKDNLPRQARDKDEEKMRETKCLISAGRTLRSRGRSSFAHCSTLTNR